MIAEITYSDSDKFVTIKIKGEINKHTAMQPILEAHELGNSAGINRYLMDVREARNIDNTIDQYLFAYEDCKKYPEIDTNARIAALITKGDHSHDFMETVLVNSGVTIKLFNDLSSAKKFLFEE